MTRPNSHLLCDGDGWTFINCLDPLFDDLEDPMPTVQLHRDRAVERLVQHRGDKRVWEKYRWVAEYHNAFVEQAGIADEATQVPADAMTWRFAPFV